MKEVTTDFLVVGSGAGGMTGAIAAHDMGMETLIIEKTGYYGGSSAMSGGCIWVPNNPTLVKAGVEHPVKDVLSYMQAVTDGEVCAAKQRKFIEEGSNLFEMLERKSEYMRFSYTTGYSDYHPQLKGACAEGRTIEADPFDINKLGDDKATLLPNNFNMPKGLYVTTVEFKNINMVTRSIEGKKVAIKSMYRMLSNRILGRDMHSMGTALIARFRKVLRENDIKLWLNTKAIELIVEDGKVVGVLVERLGATQRIIAKKGVLMASGGFEHNKTMRQEHLSEVAHDNFSGGYAANEGDGHKIGIKQNAAIEFMDEAWWMPTCRLPDGNLRPLVAERAIPRSIIVGADGKRFINEASPYVNFVQEQIKQGHKIVWLIIDETARKRYAFIGQHAGASFPSAWYDSGLLHSADSIAELAEKIGVDKDNLVSELANYNEGAKQGVDKQFKRGKNAYDNYYGDPTLKNPNVDVIDSAPYYAFKVVLGDLGTKGGLKTDEFARVLNTAGDKIDGLYATGNVSASVMGRDYAGAGATLGPAMVFAYVAAQHASAQENT